MMAQNTVPAAKVGVIVTLKGIDAGPENAKQIKDAQDRLIADLQAHGVDVLRRYDVLPLLALALDAAGLSAVKAHPLVAGVSTDRTYSPQ